MQYSKLDAYTSPRPDVSSMVPKTAINVLDVGCSNGSLGKSLKAVMSCRKVIGIEFDENLCMQAKKYIDEVIEADLNDFHWCDAFRNIKFDAIIFADVLEHLIDPERHLIAAKKYLEDDGCIIISLPNIRHVSSFYSIFINGTFPKRERGIFDKTHLRWFTYRDAKDFIERNGLVVDEVYCNLRWRDLPGGRSNKLIRQVFDPVQRVGLIREFLTYQFCIRAQLPTVHHERMPT